MSNPEMALVMEKEHLRNAEESDYMVMENLIQRRYEDDKPEQSSGLLSVVSETRELRVNSWPVRTLRRSSAIEGDIQYPAGIFIVLHIFVDNRKFSAVPNKMGYSTSFLLCANRMACLTRNHYLLLFSNFNCWFSRNDISVL